MMVLTASGLTFATLNSGHYARSVGSVAGNHTSPTIAPTATPTLSPTPTPPPANPVALATPKPAAPAAPAAPPGRFGLSVGNTLPGLSQAELARQLDDIKSLGVSWIRLDLDWNDIQHTGASSYTWERFDTVIAAANARGLRLLPIITYTAPWARAPECASNPTCAPANPAQFGTFAATAAARYAPRGIHHWEIWNEPNTNGFWAPQPSAAKYVGLLRAAYPLIKRADPTAIVITGGLASTDTAGGIPQLDYLQAMYASGGRPYFDAVGYHPYSFPVPPTYPADWNAWSKMNLNSLSFRSIMAAQGDTAKQIWLTEYGAPTNGPGAVSTAPNYRIDGTSDHVDEALQAQIADEFVRTAASYTWAGPSFWYSYKDGGTDAGNTENFYGLIRADGSKKPAYLSLKRAIAAHP